eukprot:1187353-Prorocentrum_minimum.AAC.1
MLQWVHQSCQPHLKAYEAPTLPSPPTSVRRSPPILRVYILLPPPHHQRVWHSTYKEPPLAKRRTKLTCRVATTGSVGACRRLRFWRSEAGRHSCSGGAWGDPPPPPGGTNSDRSRG